MNRAAESFFGPYRFFLNVAKFSLSIFGNFNIYYIQYKLSNINLVRFLYYYLMRPLKKKEPDSGISISSLLDDRFFNIAHLELQYPIELLFLKKL